MKFCRILFANQKPVLLLFFFLFIVSASFGEILWTTVQNNNVRVIPLSSVKAEILRLSSEYQWFYTNVNFTRNELFIMNERGLNAPDPFIRRDNERRHQWLNNNLHFIYAVYVRGTGVSVYLVSEENARIITFMDWNPVGAGISTRDRQRLEQAIDSRLADITSSPSQITNSIYNLRMGYLTTSFPVSTNTFDRTHRTSRWENLNSSWFTQVNLQSNRTETQIRIILSNNGFTSFEQNEIFSEFKNEARAIQFNYKDTNGFFYFIHIER